MYEVTAPVVVVTGDTPSGPALTYVYEGSVLPGTAKPEQVAHLLRRRMIRKVDVPGVAAPSAQSLSGMGGDGGATQSGSGEDQAGAGPVDSVSFDDPERQAAREKLPPAGTLPDGRASQAVWVEAAVRDGYAYDAAKASTKQELQDLLRK